MQQMKIGMVGVGLMGHGIAKNVLIGGYHLSFLHHGGNQPDDDLLALGAARVEGLRQLAAESDVILLCLSGSPQVEEVLTGSAGMLAAIRPQTVIIDCSTAIPASTLRLAASTREAGGQFMDAAMTRTPVEAEQGRLNLLVGAGDDLFARMRPLLDCFAENIFHAGDVGAGHTLKLLHNYVSVGFATLLGEAAACARKSGIPDEVFVDVLAKGGGHGAALDRIAPFLLRNDPSGMKFAISNAAKDIAYYLRMSEDVGAPRDAAAGIDATLRSLTDAGHAEAYLSQAAALFARPLAQD
ncbi:NAD(P)-dependent oxidoreductase [Paracoccus beibuensis]|uniref:NAD(P)-dependent oxidoreductase n=1 Tax=Paracoccus beibuensis TaxID=547602 RepID=UPI0022409561|nr:NAD(P)-dependent oxidoreductase [Paracoccus beibuensis]